VSIRDLAVATKISARVLEALERNDASKLPGGIFARSFVRSYAREVGLDPEAAVARFVLAFPDESGADEMPSATGAVEAQSFELRRRALKIGVRLAGVALLAALVAFLYYSWFSPGAGGSGSSAADQPPAAGTAAQSPAAPPSQPPASEPVVPPPVVADMPASSAAEPASATDASGRRPQETAPPAEADPAPAPPPAAEPAGAVADVAAPLVVVLTFSDECWLSVSVDGARRPSRTAAAGERLEFPVTRSITMTIGNAGAASVTLNGRPARAFGVAGQVVTRTITAADYESLLR
jgi:cytoskeleton protein RodZ